MYGKPDGDEGGERMRTVREEDIVLMLEERADMFEIDDCDEMEHVAVVMSGVGDARQIELANEHLRSCESCSRALLELNGLTAQGVIEPIRPAKKKKRFSISIGKSWTLNQWLLPAAAAVFLLLVGTLGLMRMLGQPEGAGLVLKGTGDKIHLAVQRASSNFRLKKGDKILSGDKLGLFYTAEASGFLAIFSLNAKGQTEVLFPTDGNMSAHVEAASQKALSDGAIVDEGSGCEWIIGVFSDEPLPLRKMEAFIRDAQFNNQTCSLALEIPGARRTDVFEFMR